MARIGLSYSLLMNGKTNANPAESRKRALHSSRIRSSRVRRPVQGIRDTASGANLKLLLALIGRLETRDAQASEKLQELANHYDYEDILRVLPGDPA
jgi:hypothetical protein